MAKEDKNLDGRNKHKLLLENSLDNPNFDISRIKSEDLCEEGINFGIGTVFSAGGVLLGNNTYHLWSKLGYLDLNKNGVCSTENFITNIILGAGATVGTFLLMYVGLATIWESINNLYLIGRGKIRPFYYD